MSREATLLICLVLLPAHALRAEETVRREKRDWVRPTVIAGGGIAAVGALAYGLKSCGWPSLRAKPPTSPPVPPTGRPKGWADSVPISGPPDQESLATISTESRLAMASEAREWLKANGSLGPREARLALGELLYDHLTDREVPKATIEVMQRSPQEKEHYYRALSGLDFQERTKPPRSEGGWRHFVLKSFDGTKSPAPERMFPQGIKGTLSPKSYFTFRLQYPSAQAEVGASLQFLKDAYVARFPELARRLDEINAQTGGSIKQFKIPDGVSGLYSHTDSLVVHYNDPAVAPLVERAVEAVFGKENLVERVRGVRGFDLDLSSGKSYSHGAMVAQHIAGQLIDHRATALARTPREISEWLEKTIYDGRNWSSDEVRLWQP